MKKYLKVVEKIRYKKERELELMQMELGYYYKLETDIVKNGSIPSYAPTLDQLKDFKHNTVSKYIIRDNSGSNDLQIEAEMIDQFDTYRTFTKDGFCVAMVPNSAIIIKIT